MRSACTRCGPSATNISPTTLLPDAMPPVRPTFSNRPPAEQSSPQRHRDAEKTKKKEEKRGKFFSVPLCLCGERFSFAGKFRNAFAATHFRGFRGVVHQHRYGEWTDAARNGRQGPGDF